MFVDPLAEETFEPYSYTGNNPIMFTDPTGMSKQQGGDLKKKTPIQGVPDFFNSGFDRDKLVKNLGKAMGINAHFIYSSVNSNVGGYYDRDNNTIMISNRGIFV